MKRFFNSLLFVFIFSSSLIGQNEQEAEEELITIEIGNTSYSLSENSSWMSLPIIETQNLVTFDLKKVGNSSTFTGSIANRELTFLCPDSLFLYVNEFTEKKAVWLASEVFESYRYYPETVPIYSRKHIALRIVPVEKSDIELLNNFTDKRRDFILSASEVFTGERYYFNEESRAVHCIRYVFSTEGEAYLVDGFQQLGSHYDNIFLDIVKSIIGD